jgi:hypothetical protein
MPVGYRAPVPNQTIPGSPPPVAGQTGIRLREALAAGDGLRAAHLVGDLDTAHRIELLLGAALRDGREDFSSARAFPALLASGRDEPEAWRAFCVSLARPGADRRLDDLAASWIAAGVAPDRWTPAGREPSADERVALRNAREPDAVVARLLEQGRSGLAILDSLPIHPLLPAVSLYYRQGTIHALGPRPLLVASIVSAIR